MKHLLTLAALAPGSAFAHGAHAPVPEAVHTVSHAAPFIGAGLIVLVVGVALHQRFLS